MFFSLPLRRKKCPKAIWLWILPICGVSVLSDVGRAAPADDDGGGRLLLLEPLKSTNSRSPMRQVDTESAGSVVIGTTLISPRGGRSAFRQDPCLVSGETSVLTPFLFIGFWWSGDLQPQNKCSWYHSRSKHQLHLRHWHTGYLLQPNIIVYFNIILYYIV